jgi:hypothetical protein
MKMFLRSLLGMTLFIGLAAGSPVSTVLRSINIPRPPTNPCQPTAPPSPTCSLN